MKKPSRDPAEIERLVMAHRYLYYSSYSKSVIEFANQL